MQVTVELPDEVARHLGDNPEAVARRVLEDAVVENYREGRLSVRQLAESLGFDYWQTEDFLKQRDVPLNYSAADLKADRETLDKLFKQS